MTEELKNKFYCLYFFDTQSRKEDRAQEYGYWTGIDYTVCGEKYPVCTSEITEKTKKYTYFKNAESAMNRIVENCKYEYVSKIEVREVIIN